MFNGDTFIAAEMERLVKARGIKTIVETGTHTGGTTLYFSKIVEHVITIECNAEFFAQAQMTIGGCKNVRAIFGNSGEVLRGLVDIGQDVLFFLDAHWNSYNPLLDELRQIKELGLRKCVITIHDFKVPGKPFGFDGFPNGAPYEWAAIAPYIEAIYGKDGFTYHYNEETTAVNRGIIFIEPA